MNRKGMAGMIRLHKWQLDEKRRNLVALEKMRDDLLQQVRNLEVELSMEQKRVAEAPVVSITYGDYAQQVMVRRRNITDSITEIDVSLEAVKDEVAEAFKELKKYEVVEQREQERVRQERNLRQQNEADELALNIHRRQVMNRQNMG